MIRKLVRNLTFLFFFLILPVIASASPEHPLLRGHVNTAEPKEITIVYDFQGDIYSGTVTTDASGNFVYDGQLPVEETDVVVYIDGKPHGAYLRRGSTTVADFGETAGFRGDNVAESRFYNTYQQAFNPKKFKSMPDVKFVYADAMKRLADGRDRALSDASHLSGSLRERAGRLVGSSYDKFHLMLLSIETGESGADSTAVTDAILARIDPNADESRLSGIISYWYNNTDFHRSGNVRSILDYMIGQFAAVDSALTNEGNKKNLYSTLGSMFMTYQPSADDVAAFYAGVEPQLSKAPMVKKNLDELRESMTVRIKDGDAVPVDPVLIASDGSKSRLSDILARKKVVYIDIWATWCGPCCREIPHMDKLVERFKGNDAIVFVSISRDDDRDAWLRKLDRDKPVWPQYVFDKASGDKFMDAMSIRGIPRFLIIGPDGRFISVDAERPSDSGIDAVLNAAIASARQQKG